MRKIKQSVSIYRILTLLADTVSYFLSYFSQLPPQEYRDSKIHQPDCLLSLHYILALSAQSVQRQVAGWTIRGMTSEKGQVTTVHNRPDRPLCPPNLLFTGYRGFFPGVKRPGREVNPSLLVPRLGISGSVVLLPLPVSTACIGTTLRFTYSTRLRI